jgi:predicted nuclease with RNAse H fold
MESSMHIGIDFGAKLSGTTAICMGVVGERLEVACSKKGQDADHFLNAALKGKAPATVCIDAPLSLPLAYRQAQMVPDFFYREADRQIKAMSPLFLGGLTARACRLAHEWSKQGFSVFEGYPGGLIKSLKQVPEYKTTKAALPPFQAFLETTLQTSIPELNSWHEADAVLAWWIGSRIKQQAATSIGNPNEGLIWI